MICMLPSWEGRKQGKEEEEEEDDEKETHVKVNDEELKRVSDLLNKGGDAIFLCKTEKKRQAEDDERESTEAAGQFLSFKDTVCYVIIAFYWE